MSVLQLLPSLTNKGDDKSNSLTFSPTYGQPRKEEAQKAGQELN